MPTQQPKAEQTESRERADKRMRDQRVAEQESRESHEMPCPVCGMPMPDLKGGKATICPVCGFKDSCCY